MSRCSTTVDDALQWVGVSRAQPCRICGAVSGCTRLESGEFADCRQTVSGWPMQDGGWLHRLDEVPLQEKMLLAACSESIAIAEGV